VTSAHKGYIFLAEDDADFRQALQGALEREGYLVLGARNGREALARMYGFTSAALAIIDLSMPLMNGTELIAAMRADRDLAHIPILAVSGHRQQATLKADRFLAKPFPLDQLVSTISELLNERTPTLASRRRTTLPPSL
jgi:CheY-like chemotaxis protein